MNATEALAEMKLGKTLKSKEWVGWFHWTGSGISFACPGDYPCCHDWMSEEEFLERNNDDDSFYVED